MDKLLQNTPTFDVKPEGDGFILVGKPGRLDEFSDLVREAAEQAGKDFVVFPTSEGSKGYSRAFILPLDGLGQA